MLVLGWPLVGLTASSSLILGLLAVNTLQSGRLIHDKRYDEVFSSSARRTMTVDSLKVNLRTKKEFTQLFLRCSAPKEIDRDCIGCYDGHMLNLGVCAPLSKFIANRLFGPAGEWAGKELGLADGVNLFLIKSHRQGTSSSSSSKSRTGAVSTTPLQRSRAKRFTCSVEKSVLDGEPVIRLNYAPFNRFDPIAWGMQDEIRIVNDNILIGCGGLALSGGVRNFAPFLLESNNN